MSFQRLTSFNPSPPAAFSTATGFGVGGILFFDDFTKINTIDDQNTQNAGYNWYLFNESAWSGGSFTASPSTGYSSVNSSLWRIKGNPFNPAKGGQFFTATGFSTAVKRTVPLIDGSKPFYIEGRFNINMPGATDGSQPSFWIFDLDGVVCSVKNNNAGHSFAEIDIFEHAPPNLPQTIYAYNGTSSPWSNTQISATGWTANSWHTVGVLSVPMASNGGTGFVRWYIDRVSSRTDATWTSGSAYSCVELSKFIIILGNAQNNSMLIDYVAVWQ